MSEIVEITTNTRSLTSARILLQQQFVLAFIIGLHLLAVLMWLQKKQPRVEQRPTLISILLRPSANVTAPSPDRPSPSIDRTPTVTSKKRLPDHVISLPDASSFEADTNRSDAVSEAASSAAASSPDASFDLNLVRRQASRVARTIARELPAVPSGAETPWTRFGRDVDAAHLEAGVWQDSYTAPDGTIIYRKHIGGRTFCRMSGNVGPENGVIKGIDEAGSIACPTRTQWKREP